MIKVNSLSKAYRKKNVLDDVTFNLSIGITGLLGPNGSGKTTLFRILADVLEPSGGSITYQDRNGRDISKKNCKIGYLPQLFGLIKDYTLWEHMEYFSCLKGIPTEEWEEEITSALGAVYLLDEKNKKCKKLSGGMVRRAGIAQAILGKPDMMLLDEPTTGLDPEERIRFQNLILNRKKQCPIIIATHLVEDIMELCSETFVLSNGRLLFHNYVERLASLAEGKVFLMTEEYACHWRDYGIKIKSQYGENGELYTRFLQLKNPPVGYEYAKLIEPQIEDGYMYLLKTQKEYNPYD